MAEACNHKKTKIVNHTTYENMHKSSHCAHSESCKTHERFQAPTLYIT